MRHGDDKIIHRMVPIAWRPPFALGERAYVDFRPYAETIFEMVRSVPNLPREFFTRGVVCVNGRIIPRSRWLRTLPPPRAGEPIAVTMHLPLGKGASGGGSGGAKSIISLVAAFALVVVTGGIAGGFLAPVLGASFAAGGVGAIALSAAVGIGGALAISALSPPPSLANIGAASAGLAQSSDNTDQKQPASASGNTLTPGGSIPRVVGTRMIFPPLIGQPIVELVDDDEVVEAAFILNGPHQLSDVRINSVAIADAEDVVFETRQGFAGDTLLTLVTRYGKTVAPQLTLSVPQVNPNTQNLLAHPSAPAGDLPVWHGVASPARTRQDEIWLHFLLPNGISINGSTSTDIGIPLRIRFRLRGTSAWTNLPEIHISDSTLQQRRRAVLFQWRSRPGVIEPIPARSGFVYANKNVPGQTTLPSTDAWIADPYFNAGSGLDYLNAGTEGTTGIQHINLFANRVEVYLDVATFVKGVYEIEVKRGTAYKVSSFTPSTYLYNGSVQDFFNYSNVASPTIPESRANLADSVGLVRVVSVINSYPVLKAGFALVAMKATNRDISQVSVLASGLVRDWDGTGWNTWTATSYAAAHYADILCGANNIDPLPVDLRDDTGLVAWRTECIAHGWKCDAIIDDFRTQDALTLLASCGYARPYQCEIYGVTVDDDVSANAPVQIFSRRNAANVRFEKAFARPPSGFIVNFTDASANYSPAQIEVDQRDSSIATTGLFETVTYDGLVDQAAVRARALFDLDQANLRSTFYYLDTDIESIVCRKGDLIGFEHDVLSGRAGDGLLKSKTVLTGNITTLVLDSTIPITNELPIESIGDISLVPDIALCGITTGIAVRRRDASISTHALSNVTGESDTLTLATPVTDTSNILGFADTDGKYGCLVVAGDLSSIYRRMKVSSIAPAKDLQATLTAVDEAQALVRL